MPAKAGMPCPFFDRRGGADSLRATAPPPQTFGWPLRHCAQLPQKPERHATTWSPGRSVVTWSPTASTTPAPSWPSTSPRSSGNRPSPSTTWRSLWQTPVPTVRTRTSRASGRSTSIDSMATGTCVARQTAARISMASPSVVQPRDDPRRPRTRIPLRGQGHHLRLGGDLVQVGEVLDLVDDLGQDRAVHRHAALEDLPRLLVSDAGALLLLREV